MTEKRKRANDCHCATQQLTIWILGAVALVSAAGIMVLVGIGKTPDAALYQLPTAAIAALAASYMQGRLQSPQSATTVNAGPRGQVDVAADGARAEDGAQGDTVG